jgi:hypothetical protein
MCIPTNDKQYYGLGLIACKALPRIPIVRFTRKVYSSNDVTQKDPPLIHVGPAMWGGRLSQREIYGIVFMYGGETREVDSSLET